jgi:hypothetical protein
MFIFFKKKVDAFFLFLSFTFLMGLASCHNNSSSNKNILDLAGEWDFQIDSLDKGISEKWFAENLNNKITLPGSMLTNGKGNDITATTKWTGGIWDSTWYKSPEFAKYRQPGNVKVSFWLQPLKHYVGVAWYKKKIKVPADWKNKYTELFLERCHWETTLWVDTKKVGMQNALGAPHVYDLSKILTPGEHTLTLRIDNRIKDIDPGWDAHSLSDNTQTNWNGIVGKMNLISRHAVYISDVQFYPDIDKKIVKAAITIKSLLDKETDYQLSLSATSANAVSKVDVNPLHQKIHINKGATTLEIAYPMGTAPLLWDEFNPNVYTLTTEISGEAGTDSRDDDFGMKNFSITGTQFYVNDRPVFLRGTLECAIFPKTGYASTLYEDWDRIYKKCKAYGLNHIRFHSWCPPEAAFNAADRNGIYLSVEASGWSHLGAGAPIDQYIYDESNRIVKNFGNHPSFCMMPYGNEASGDSAVPYLTKFVQYWQQKDKRRVYTSASGFPQSPASDYTSSANPRIQWWEAGLKSPINANAPTTDFDWTQYLEKNKPTVSHEIGQWCVYPNFKEMSKYDGVLKPKNFEIFQEKLEEHGMKNLADSFLFASGKLQVLCYKADIEAALRTPGFAGFQLLDLHDFPGQGTALVGVLDPFWEEKGYVTSKEYSLFCNATVPLLRMSKMIYLDTEEINAAAELTHYGKDIINNSTAGWTITSSDGKILKQGRWAAMNISFGNNKLGVIKQPLNFITKPEQLTITVKVKEFENSWNIWVYPTQQPVIANEPKIKIAQSFDAATVQYVENGGTVLLTVKKGSIKPQMGGDVPVGFSSIFWNTQWTGFKQPPFTLGILCNPKHPALATFPTDYYSNWQWWDAMSHCIAIRLDSISPKLQPIVRIIDDWFTAKPLAMIFECKVGKGKLLVSGTDLISNTEKRTEARQLLYSLKNYMGSEIFNPVVEVSAERIKSLFVNNK